MNIAAALTQNALEIVADQQISYSILLLKLMQLKPSTMEDSVWTR